MNLGELRRMTAHLSDDIDVMLVQTDDENYFGMVQSAIVQEIQFQADDIPKKDWPTIECLVISDEF